MMAWLMAILAGLVGSLHAQNYQLRPPGPVVFPTSRPVESCLAYQATCNSGQCIDRSQVCDGNRDCSDGSDESGCRPYNECEPNELQCSNKKCILKTWRCDGDDDCGDGSDEADCRENDPESPCRYYEWQCASEDQCIPKSFHCDGEMDCQDQSDEIGCTGPIIIISPPPLVPVERSYTFVINCTAMGIPTPEVVWRLNWGHVPDKCSMTNSEEDGNRVFGELTCPSSQLEDSGAYSCEAINSMGSCFAGSAGCGQPGQDAIVVVSGASVCATGTFNNQASSKSDCLPCFCSGLSSICSGADLYLGQLPPPAGIFHLLLWRPDSAQAPRLHATAAAPESGLGRMAAMGQLRIQEQNPVDNGVLYFALPASHTGNQVKSYGGYLRYTISFAGGDAKRLDEPDVVMEGNGMSLRYYLDSAPSPDRETQVEVRFWPGSWYKDYNNPATKDDILRVLADLQYLLLKAQQTESMTIDTTISDIKMDTAQASDSGYGRVNYVEQCVCPPGYTGLSCERCAPGYTSDESTGAPGTCRRPSETCPAGYYNHPDTGECNVCPCPLTIPSNQFGTGCSVDADGQILCECRAGYTGRRCGDCAPGYTGNPALPGGSCSPGSECNFPDGSYDRTPDPYTGNCRCRQGYTGTTCSTVEMTGCGENEFLSQEQGLQGCLSCFCMGIPTDNGRTPCQPSGLYRYKEKAVFHEDTLGFSLTNKEFTQQIPATQLKVDKDRQEVFFDQLASYPESVFYWKLPYQFLGNKLTSYGGWLEFSLRFVPNPDPEQSQYQQPVTDALIELQGNDINLVNNAQPVVRTEDEFKYKVRMHEQQWTRVDGGNSNREHLMMALADLDHIIIRANYDQDTLQAGISDVSLECAVNRSTGGNQASAVEGCVCPIGYKGLSCEDCAPGYTRSGSGVYLGTCQPCQCNGRTNSCDPETGECLDCRDNTAGPFCSTCQLGFFMDSRTGNCLPSSDSGDDDTAAIGGCACDPRGSQGCEDDTHCICKPNVEGERCDTCRPGTFGLGASAYAEDGCTPCYCSGVTDQCHEARLFWSTLRLNAYEQTFELTAADAAPVATRYNGQTGEMVGQVSPGEADLYWILPHQQVGGSKLGAYGGNLTVIQRMLGSDGASAPPSDHEVVLVGGGLTLTSNAGVVRSVEGEEMYYKVPMLESAWMEGSGYEKTTATRADLLKALANIEAIKIRASQSVGTVETAIRKVMLDIGVPQMTGGPPVEGAEECLCPAGYAGASCESCARGFYRDWSTTEAGNSCLRCPCQGNEERCDKEQDGSVRCTCKAGYTGQQCEQRGSAAEPMPDMTESWGEEDAPINITFTQPPVQMVEPGQTVRFNCNAMPRFSTQDPTTISWAKENGILPAGRSRDDGAGLLVITEVQSADSGTYLCTATIGRFTTRKRATLNVQPTADRGGDIPIAPIASIDPANQQVNVGTSLQISCNTFGNPMPQISWSHNGRTQLGPRTRVQGMQLYIEPVMEEDRGEYVCTSVNYAGRAQARTVIYVVGQSDPRPPSPSFDTGPTITISPADQTVVTRDTAIFDCQVTGVRDYTIIWSKQDGSPLPYRAVADRERLTISDAQAEDTGLYVCQATTRTGTVLEAQARLVVMVVDTSGEGVGRNPPNVRIDPDEQTIGQGDSTEMRCTGSGVPAPSLEWSKVGEDMSSPNLEVTMAPDGSSLLRVVNVAVADRGMYLCTASNVHGSARASTILEVERREPPTIQIYPESSQTITKSGSVLFQCRAIAGIPTPVVSWARVDGTPIAENVELLDGGVLRLNQATGDEQGQYICRAENQAGSVDAIATLLILEVPTIELQPAGSVTRQAGTPLSISCSVRGDPPPAISWTKLGTTTRDLGVSSPTFEIGSLTKADEGTYACIATNNVGQAEERVQIIVLQEDEFFPYADYPDNSGGRYPDNSGSRYPDNSGGRYPDNSGGRYPDNSGERYPDNSGGQYPDSSGGRYPDNSGGRYPDNSGGRYPDNSGGRYPDNSGGMEDAIPLDDREPATLGSNINLNCFTIGDSSGELSATWRRKDDIRFPTRHYQQNGILSLVDVDEDDAVTYVCEVKNNAGTTVYQLEKTIELADAPLSPVLQVRLDQERVMASPGESPALTCSAIGDTPIQLFWRREDGRQLSQSVAQLAGRLQFSRITSSDAGRYMCTAINNEGQSTATAEVIVDDYGTAGGPYREEAEPERISASEGASIDLPCRLPQGSRVSWRRDDGGQLPRSATQRGMGLYLGQLTSQDSGRYTCYGPTGSRSVELRVEPALQCTGGEFTCSNNAGCVPRSQLCDGEFDCTDGSDEMACGLYRSKRSLARLGIRELARKPNVVVEPSLARPYLGGSLDITCKLQGEIPESYDLSWTRVGNQLPVNSRTRDNLIRFVNLSASDGGLYRCQAETPEGTFYNDYNLMVAMAGPGMG